MLKRIGTNIAAYIRKRGYNSLERFAHEHKIHKGTLSKVVNGRVDVRISTLCRIAKALELDLRDVIAPGDSAPEN